MEQFLYGIIGIVTSIHNRILELNNGIENSFTDKELHFVVLGIVGLAMVLVIHPIFVWLAKNDHTIVITFLYVFTLMVVIAFAIEIGQRLTGTGAMEFADIVYGIAGFLAAFLVFAAARAIVRFIASAFSKGRRHKRR